MKKILLFACFTIVVTSCTNSPKAGSSSMDIDSSIVVKKYLEDHYKMLVDSSGHQNMIFNSVAGTPFEQNVLPQLKGFYSAFALLGVDDPININNYSIPIKYQDANTIIERYNQVFSHSSFLFKVQPLLDYINYAKSKSNDLVNFRFMSGIFKPTTGNYQRTLIIVGLNKDNQYVLYNGTDVFEHCLPCPFECPKDLTTGMELPNIIK